MLARSAIIDALQGGDIMIDPFDGRNLGPNSYDVRLGEYFWFPDRNLNSLDVTAIDPTRVWQLHQVSVGYGVPLDPGVTILAHTEEFVSTHGAIVAKMHARSSIGRWGLSVCKCAGFGDLEYSGRWTMEISNHTGWRLMLRVGMRIAQLEFDRAEMGPEMFQAKSDGYAGKYGRDRWSWSPQDMLPHLDHDWDVDGVPFREPQYG